MLRLIRQHRWIFGGVTLAGLALRVFFVVHFPAVTDDSHMYADVGTNWLEHGIYGETQGGHPEKPILPTDSRLPGYPAFLAGIFWIFGTGNFRAVMLAQVLLDIGTCIIIADLARRVVSARAAKIAFALATLCPFLANYTAAVLTETLEVFFTALVLDFALVALNRTHSGEAGALSLWSATGGAIGACILLRPDGGILLAAVVLYLAVATAKGLVDAGTPTAWLKRNPDTTPSGTKATFAKAEWKEQSTENRRWFFRSSVAAGTILVVFALAPLIPWAIRNFHTFHHFQPLAPRYANEMDELVTGGFNRWVKTWMTDYVSVEEIYWNVPGDKIDAQKLPSRAFDNLVEKDTTLALIAEYNESQDMTSELDARFGELATDRIRDHPVRYYVWLPALRVADMWLRPRTELLPADVRWWEFHDTKKESALAVGFGLLNLAYVGAALLALIRRPSGIRWDGLLIVFLLLRSVFLATLENPEPRYTLEGYPVIILCAAAYFANAPQRKFGSQL